MKLEIYGSLYCQDCDAKDNTKKIGDSHYLLYKCEECGKTWTNRI